MFTIFPSEMMQRNSNSSEVTLAHLSLKIRHGIIRAQDIAGKYNDIARWLGMPQVPKPFLKK
jgi:hypothetical protein